MDRKAVLDWVAENIMGFKRGDCKGDIGGGNISGDGQSEYWFWCDMCGREVRDYKTSPCPSWRFPHFDLEDVIRYIGNKGLPVMVGCDPLRDTDCFTVMISNIRRDADEPFWALCELAYEMREKS